ncbi:hypothetical protein C7H19_04040 [Aphanothece hegewaldii CCALA 016]|uniref:Fibrillin n=1 Tax=Aphanothece hegewaldii CCALA 016 TaxID=2107694 RepID=A0A2T1M1V8_9CHRO|nr:hypothetical protein [Aphanothece hegewaldii]PSF38687.1 hypothetical protein C7H19_04040 [Aphanothece hegewaldii CCALA 016]
MNQNIVTLEQAANSFITQSADKPIPEIIVKTLLEEEKAAKKNKNPVSFQQLEGAWRLFFITGTKKARDRAGIILGSGKYLPHWVKIYISYCQNQDETANIVNSVNLGTLKLSLSGPTQILPNKNIVVFNFTRMTLQVFGKKIFSGDIRGGKKSEENFYKVQKKEAFFSYFAISDKIIAARGRGGGLAIWTKEEQK